MEASFEKAERHASFEKEGAKENDMSTVYTNGLLKARPRQSLSNTCRVRRNNPG